MALPLFRDHNTSEPFQITGEVHTIDAGGRVCLEHVPLKGTGGQAVTIAGYTETTSATPGLTEFYIDYQSVTDYRTALGFVQFSLSKASEQVTVNYYGVSTVLWARAMNEIKSHIEAGNTNVTHTGDVTGSEALTIANKAVTLAKMADMATASLIYRKSALSGVPEVQTLATLKTDLGLTGTNSGDQNAAGVSIADAGNKITATDVEGALQEIKTAVDLNTSKVTNATHTGDVTGADTLTIAAKAVTLAKMNDVSTSTVFYRKTAGTGIPEVQSLDTLKTDLNLTGTNSGDQNAAEISIADVGGIISASNVEGALQEIKAATDLNTVKTSNVTHTGDVTGSGALTIAAKAVTLAKMADITESTIMGRNTAGTGVVELLSIATVKTMLGLGTAAYVATGTFATAAQGTLATNAVPSSAVGAASGVCPLGADTKIAAIYLPSYVDDALEYANLAALPVTGTSGILYVTINDNKVYRWSGTVYVEVSASPGSTDAVTEGSTNKYYTDVRVRAAVLTGLSLATSSDVDATITLLDALGRLQAQVTKCKTFGFTLSIFPSSMLNSGMVVKLPFAGTITNIDVICRDNTMAAINPQSGGANITTYSSGSAIDSGRSFTVADTSFSGLSIAVAADGKIEVRINANNFASATTVSISYKGVRT